MATLRWSLLLLMAMALPLWVWTRPLSLPVVDTMAEQVVRAKAAAIATRTESAPARATIDTRTDEWLAANNEQVDRERAQLTERLRDLLTYKGEDGRAYPYLGNLDSYAWLREARNWLRTGQMCDAVVDGHCRDTYVYAPLGGDIPYTSTGHVAAIVALHRLIRWFHPLYPLPASAMLVPIIVIVLASVPAFGIGRLVAGDLGGLVAAVLITCNPIVFHRSFGSDNDVWNVALPLWMMWAAMAALSTASTPRRVLYAVAAAAICALHALIWSGWLFTYIVLLAALIGVLTLRTLAPLWRAWRQQLPWHAWRTPAVRAAATVVVVFYVATGMGIRLSAADQPYFSLPLRLGGILRGQHVGTTSPPVAGADVWPDVFETVSELQPVDLTAVAAALGGRGFLCGSLIGIVLLLLPRRRWDRIDLALFAGGVIGAVGVVLANGAGVAVVAALCVPLLGTVALFQALRHESPAPAAAGNELVVVAWFVAALYAASGERLLLLLVVPFGLAFGALAGRLHALAVERLAIGAPRYAPALGAALFALLAAVLIPPLRDADAAARDYRPEMSDIWWNTLERVRARSAPDAIVSTWWDYGYWVKYVAERGVNADGASLQSHVPYWLARALVTGDERESVGLLRMLDCGSDATPYREGRDGAYGKLLATLHDPLAAQAVVIALAKLDRADAAAYLAARGFTPAAQQDVLASTHCAPPEGLLILPSSMVNKDAWLRLAQWNFSNAFVARLTRTEPPAAVIHAVEERFALPASQAATLDAQARTLALEAFAMPKAMPVSIAWTPCRIRAEGSSWHCPMALANASRQPVVYDFEYDPDAPTRSQLRPMGTTSAVSTDATQVSTLVIAGDDGLQDVALGAPTGGSIAMLVDVANRRVLSGPLPFLHSVFTQLYFLDGRYTTRFEKFDDEVSDLGRVVTWKMKWE